MYKYSLVNPVNRLSSKFIPILVLGLHSVTTTFTLTTFEVKPFLLAPAVTVGERRELWILPPFFLASSFAYNFVRK